MIPRKVLIPLFPPFILENRATVSGEDTENLVPSLSMLFGWRHLPNPGSTPDDTLPVPPPTLALRPVQGAPA